MWSGMRVSLEDSVCNVTDMQFACLRLDCLLIDYANGILENTRILPFYSISIGTYSDGGRQTGLFCFLSARHPHVNTTNVIAPHGFVPTGSLSDCSMAQCVPNRFIVTVNIVNV